jgi:flagellar biosynthesis/type III secretory pathway protein FliH
MRRTLAMTAMTVAALGLGSAGCATHYGRWGYHERYDDGYRIGYDCGYDDGYRQGRADGHHHDRYDFRHAREYRHADRGYRSAYGPWPAYSNAYRRGYEEGYRKAFDAARDHRHDWGRPR